MKKIKSIILLLVLCISCLYSLDFKAGEIAKEKIIIDDIELEKMAEVYAIDSSKTGKNITVIKGSKPPYVDTQFWSNQGVFIPGRTVKIRPFIISKYEVTQELYTTVMKDQQVIIGNFGYNLNAEPYRCKNFDSYPTIPNDIQKYRPADSITWYDAVFFCNALTEKTMSPEDKAYSIVVKTLSPEGNIIDAIVTLDINKKGYRLPTESEWEFAARGGDQQKIDWNYCYSGAPKGNISFERFIDLSGEFAEMGNVDSNLNNLGWYRFVLLESEDGSPRGYLEDSTHEVGLKQPNILGLYDMTGNVSEWCFDGLEKNLSTGDFVNPVGKLDSNLRVTRGGNFIDSLEYISVTWRSWGNEPYKSYRNVGFRIVRSVIE